MNGFTWEQVDALRNMAAFARLYSEADDYVLKGRMGDGRGFVPYHEITLGDLRLADGIADIIEPTLPPRPEPSDEAEEREP